jgi:hypothetical protein
LSKPNFLKLTKKQSHKLSGLWEVCLPPNNFPFPGLTNSFVAFIDLLLVADGKGNCSFFGIYYNLDLLLRS